MFDRGDEKRAPLLTLKGKDLVRAPAFGVRVASFCLSLYDERFQGSLCSDSGSDSLTRNEPEDTPSAGHEIIFLPFPESCDGERLVGTAGG